MSPMKRKLKVGNFLRLFFPFFLELTDTLFCISVDAAQRPLRLHTVVRSVEEVAVPEEISQSEGKVNPTSFATACSQS